MDKPLITVINGAAAGAGFGLAILGDIVSAARSAKSRLLMGRSGCRPTLGQVGCFRDRWGCARPSGWHLVANGLIAAAAREEDGREGIAAFIAERKPCFGAD